MKSNFDYPNRQVDIFEAIENIQHKYFSLNKLIGGGAQQHLACLMSEVGELATVFKHIQIDRIKFNNQAKDKLMEEISDCVIILTIMSMALDRNLDKAIRDKLVTICTRMEIKNELKSKKRYGNLIRRKK